MYMRGIRPAKLVLALALPQLAGFIGAIATARSLDTWYQALEKPVLTPPSWVFGPVWIILYLMLGVALYLVWTRRVGGRARRLWLRLFFVQLVLNTLWSFLFFGLQNPQFAFFEILVLLASIVGLIVLALRFDKRVAGLLVPYLVWVSFASYLTWAIWQLNP